MGKKLLIKGNEAIAMGALNAGLEAFFGYPITPQTELMEFLSKEMPKQNKIFVQAESEISAINMVLGAAATGKAAMTSSSSPGISLKQEGISYMAGGEIPGVIVNVMRGGPGLGNIAPSQSDYFQAVKGGGHGDYHNIVLAPNSVKEMFSIMKDAFNLAFKYRNPVMVLADGVLGQMMENIELPEKKEQLNKGDLSWTLSGAQNRKPRAIHSLYLKPEDLEQHNLKLIKKYKEIEQNEKRFELYKCDDAEICIVAFGLSSRISKAVVDSLRKNSKRIGLFRPISLWPFPKEELIKTTKKAKEIWVIELNSGQMIEDVKLTLNNSKNVRFYGRLGGMLPIESELIKFFTKTKAKSNI